MTRKRTFIEALLSQYVLPSNAKCSACAISTAFYRCRTCHRNQLLCCGCMRNTHRTYPFHRIEQWNGSFFQRTALWQVGVQLIVPNSEGPCDCMSYQIALIDGQEIA